MAETGITIALKAVDQTQAAFGSAKAGFVAFSQSLSQTMLKAQAGLGIGRTGGLAGFLKGGGAEFALLRSAAGAFSMTLGPLVSRVKSFVAEMHRLTDLAAETGSKAADVRLLAQSFDELGIRGGSLENIANLLGRMAKTTGETGVDGFRRQMKAIAALGTEQERVTELMRVFGRTGATLAPLLRSGPDALDAALGNVATSLGGLSETGIQAASAIDKGFTAVSRDFANQWAQLGGWWAEWLSGQFQRPVEFALVAAWNRIKEFFNAFRLAAAAAAAYVYEAVAGVFRGGKWDFANYFQAALDEQAAFVTRNEILLDKLQAGATALETTDLNLGLEEGAEALSAAASKVSDAMNPAKWTDAASYAGQTLVLAAQNAIGRTRSIAPSGIGPSGGSGSPRPAAAAQSAPGSLANLVTRILEALRENGREAKTFFDSFPDLQAI